MNEALEQVMNNATTTRMSSDDRGGLFEAMPMAENGATMTVKVMMVNGDHQELTLDQLLTSSSKEQLDNEQECLDVVKRIAAGELVLFDFQQREHSVTMLFKDGERLVAHGYGVARWIASFTRADGELGFFCLNPGMVIQKAA